MASLSMSLSVKGAVHGPDGRYLLVRRSPASKAHAGKWEFSGGKSDPGESIDAALIREVREETGLAITIGAVLGATESLLRDRRVVYLFCEACAASEDVRLSEEHDQFAWASLHELTQYDLSPQFRSFAEALQRSGGQPVLVTQSSPN